MFSLSLIGMEQPEDLAASTLHVIGKINFYDQAHEIATSVLKNLQETSGLSIKITEEKRKLPHPKMTISVLWHKQIINTFVLLEEVDYDNILIDGTSITSTENINDAIIEAIETKIGIGIDQASKEPNALLEHLLYLPSKLSDIKIREFTYDLEVELIDNERSRPIFQINIVELKNGQKHDSCPILRHYCGGKFMLMTGDENDALNTVQFEKIFYKNKYYYRGYSTTEEHIYDTDFITYRRVYLVPFLRHILKNHFKLDIESPTTLGVASFAFPVEGSNVKEVGAKPAELKGQDLKAVEVQPSLSSEVSLGEKNQQINPAQTNPATAKPSIIETFLNSLFNINS